MSRATPRRGGNLAVNLATFAGLLLVRRGLRFFRAQRSRRPTVDPEDLAAGHELSDVRVGAVVAFGAGLLAVMALALVGVSWLQTSVTGRAPSLTLPASLTRGAVPHLPPEPRLEAVPGQELRDLAAAQDRLLHSYGWVDRQAGVARIPIERAIELVAERGLPARPAAESERFRDQGLAGPSDASSGRAMEVTRP